MAGLETQFSIYKIDSSLFSDIDGMDRKKPEERISEIIGIILIEIKKELQKKNQPKHLDIDVDGVSGIVYKTINIPDWQGMILDLVSRMDKKMLFELDNSNVSYVLLYKVNDSIYAMTAGFGNYLIKKYIERNWGLYLMPKLIRDDVGVIREVKENNLYGNALSLSKANRYTTNLIYEKQMSAVFKELSVEIGGEVTIAFGFSDDEKSNRKTNALLKDSLVLRRSMTIEMLKAILGNIYEIEKRTDKYSMGYFISANKAGIQNATLVQTLIINIKNGDVDKMCLVGDDYLKYCVGASEYFVYDDKKDLYYASEHPITFQELLELVKEEKELSLSYVSKILKKWTISANDLDGNEVLYKIPIINALQGYVEYGENKIPCFLMQGEWYCLNKKYIFLLEEEFRHKYNADIFCADYIGDKYKLRSGKKSEDKYNDSFFGSTEVIVAHKSLLDNYEIADLIFWDENYIYLMCNKKNFDGTGSRDLTNQMWASANYLQSRLNSVDKIHFLESYYDMISKRYTDNNYKLSINKQEFIKLFDRKICYVAGFMSGYTLKSKSPYAKYLVVDTAKKFQSMGYEYIGVNIGKIGKKSGI